MKQGAISSEFFIYQDWISVRKVNWSNYELSCVLEYLLQQRDIKHEVNHNDFVLIVNSCDTPEELVSTLDFYIMKRKRFWYIYTVYPYLEYLRNLAAYGNIVFFVVRSIVNVSSMFTTLFPGLGEFFSSSTSSLDTVSTTTVATTAMDLGQINRRFSIGAMHEELYVLGDKFAVLNGQFERLRGIVSNDLDEVAKLKQMISLMDMESALMKDYLFVNNDLRAMLVSKEIDIDHFNECADSLHIKTMKTFRCLLELRYRCGFGLNVYDLESGSTRILPKDEAYTSYCYGHDLIGVATK